MAEFGGLILNQYGASSTQSPFNKSILLFRQFLKWIQHHENAQVWKRRRMQCCSTSHRPLKENHWMCGYQTELVPCQHAKWIHPVPGRKMQLRLPRSHRPKRQTRDSNHSLQIWRYVGHRHWWLNRSNWWFRCPKNLLRLQADRINSHSKLCRQRASHCRCYLRWICSLARQFSSKRWCHCRVF